MRLPRNLKRKFALSLVALVVFFVVGEVITRAIEPGPFSLWDRNPYVHFEDGRGWRHKPDFEGRWDGTWYETNSLGLRGAALDVSLAPEEFRVACLGDSCTFGKGVVEDHCWPRQLEHMLQAEMGKERRALVANLGVNGYSGADYRRFFEELAPMVRPHVVVVGYNLNDFPNTIRAVDERVFKQRGLRRLISKDLRNFLGRFASYRWLRQSYYAWNRKRDWHQAESLASGASQDPADSERWQEQKEHLAAIRDLAREYGAQTAVFLFPYESQVYLETYDNTPIERLGQVCAELELPFVDLADEFRRHARQSNPPRQLFLKGDRYHPTPEGYFLVATTVLGLIREQGWLEETAGED